MNVAIKRFFEVETQNKNQSFVQHKFENVTSKTNVLNYFLNFEQ